MLRQRKFTPKIIKELDAFSQFHQECVVSSPVGGIFSLISFAVCSWLLYTEINYWRDSHFIFDFSADTEFDAKLSINIDITVAMPCSRLGADILDSTNQNVMKFGFLEEEDTWYELSPQQKRQFSAMSQINSYLREEYHAVQELLWRSSQSFINYELPVRSELPDKPFDACRFHGTLSLNKVAGLFHITAGKSIQLPRGHIHISAFMREEDYNFTHRINKFSFGDSSPGILHPLEGDEKVITNNQMLVQYFIEAVPTTVDTFLNKVKTYQYSVKEHQRIIDPTKRSGGMPGIFFKYDVSALKIHVRQERDNIITFIVRLFATIGGIHIIAGKVNDLLQFLLPKQFSQQISNQNVSSTEVKIEKTESIKKVSLLDGL